MQGTKHIKSEQKSCCLYQVSSITVRYSRLPGLSLSLSVSIIRHTNLSIRREKNVVFDILLILHQVMILGKWPTWRTILFYVFSYIFNSLHASSTSCWSSEETNFVNTTSGSCRWPWRVQVGSSLPTCTRHGHRHRVTATRGCIDTVFLSWWWARCARNM